MALELENVKSDLVRDLNQNELPIPVQKKRALAAELDGPIGQVRAGYIRLSDLTLRARPLVKNIADKSQSLSALPPLSHVPGMATAAPRQKRLADMRRHFSLKHRCDALQGRWMND